MREQLEIHRAGLEMLLAAVHANDPKREILVRIGDLIREIKAISDAIPDFPVYGSRPADE